MSELYPTTKRKELDEKCATLFSEASVAFNIVRHLVFVVAVRTTLLAWFDYEPPSYHTMRTSFIEPTKKHVETKV
jgi:hypothetical protein